MRRYVQAHVIPPTFDEIGQEVGMVKSMVRYHVRILVAEAKLVRLTHVQAARSITTPEVAAAVRAVTYEETN